MGGQSSIMPQHQRRTPKFTVRGHNRPRTIIPALGDLERRVMDEVWRKGEVSVRDVHEAFNWRPAYTTLMTTLQRLNTKKLLKRRKYRHAYLYSPRVTREEFERGIVVDVIDELLRRGKYTRRLLLGYVIYRVAERDHPLFNEVEQFLLDKKQESISTL